MITLGGNTLKYCTLGDKKCRLITLGNNVAYFDGSYYPDDTNYGIFNKNIENSNIIYYKQDNKWQSGASNTTDCDIRNIVGISLVMNTSKGANLAKYNYSLALKYDNQQANSLVVDTSLNYDQNTIHFILNVLGSSTIDPWDGQPRDVNSSSVVPYYVMNIYNYGNSLNIELHDNKGNLIKTKGKKDFYTINGITLKDFGPYNNIGIAKSKICIVQTDSSTYYNS